MKESEKLDLINQLVSEFHGVDPNKNKSINKYNKSTQTYYADEELALKKVPQNVLNMPVDEEQEEEKSLDDLMSQLVDRMDSKSKPDAPKVKGYSTNAVNNDHWHSRNTK